MQCEIARPQTGLSFVEVLLATRSQPCAPAEHLFIQTFWRTMNREWKSIDGPRLDKYCMVSVQVGLAPGVCRWRERQATCALTHCSLGS